MRYKSRLSRRQLIGTPFLIAVSRAAHAAERLIGWVSPDSPEAAEPFLKVFRAALATGVEPGSAPVRIVERFANDSIDAIPAFVAELQQLGARLIVSHGAATLPVLRAKPSIPVIFGFSADPVVAGIAQSLARPGGMASGVTFMSLELNPKRMGLVRDVLPNCQSIGLLSYARHVGEENEIVASQQAADKLGIHLNVQRVQEAGGVMPALSAALGAGAQAIVMLPSPPMVQQASAAAAECIARRVALVSGWSSIARSGALMTYGPRLDAAYAQVAVYVVKVLKGAEVATLPIERPTIFELVINMRTAKALGVKIPLSLLGQANEMIE